VARFPTPDELWERTYPTPPANQTYKQEIVDWKTRLFDVPFESQGGKWQLRYYQTNAVNAVLDSVAEKRDRILLTLATGTGKTAIAFQIVWKLYQAKWTLRRDAKRSPRILFLADRNILADQAFNSFSNAFAEDALVRISPDAISKKGRVPTNGAVFFSIFQTFMSGPDESPYYTHYEPDFFDFVIVDECHRGGANDESSWRGILEHFSPAVQLGLTATPKRDENVDTYAYFGEPVYTYALREGINDGFLTPFRVKEISTTMDTYTFTAEDDVLEGEIEEGREYTEAEINRIISIKAREEFRVKLFLGRINQKQKTLVFCANQEHAAAIRDLINQHSDSLNPDYCCRVTADDGGLGEKHLRDFQDNEKRIPTILTTSQKLSTGVDAPEIRNIVLLRPINSMVEFKQIVGRGTRLYDGKDYFTLYDFVKAHHHFKDPEWDGEPIAPEPVSPVDRPQSPSGDSLNEPDVVLCTECQHEPCLCEDGPRVMTRIRLSKGREMSIDAMVNTTFMSPSGIPITSAEFIQQLFGDLPKFFHSEDDLRLIWSDANTRKQLLEQMAAVGYSQDQLEELRKLVHGTESDLYDVLKFIAYERDMVPRRQRAAFAKTRFADKYSPAQIEFLDFILDQYVENGISELDGDKLAQLLILKYKSIPDAKKNLGSVDLIRETFHGFQAGLYS
jgi:type I restriction enzyme R subunit